MKYLIWPSMPFLSKCIFNTGGFFGHPQGGYGRHLASDGLSFWANFLSFLGENPVFFMHLVIKTQKNLTKIWPCLRSAESKRNFLSFFGSWVYEKVPKKNPCLLGCWWFLLIRILFFDLSTRIKTDRIIFELLRRRTLTYGKQCIPVFC